MRHIADNSVAWSVFFRHSPACTYTNSPYDMGNVRHIDEMVNRFRYLMDEEHLMRIVMPGECVHPSPRA